MSSPAVDIYYSLYGTILNAVTAPRGEGERETAESKIAGRAEKSEEEEGQREEA